jgi:hypothetical protein
MFRLTVGAACTLVTNGPLGASNEQSLMYTACGVTTGAFGSAAGGGVRGVGSFMVFSSWKGIGSVLVDGRLRHGL